MRTSAYIAAAAAFATTAIARPAPVADDSATVPDLINHGIKPDDFKPPFIKDVVNSWGQQQETCMNDEDAQIVAGTFQSIIQGYTVEQALAALTPDFIDYSSAVSIIINRGGSEPEDVTAPIFTSREEFMQGHGKQEPIPFETLKVWHNCNGTVSMVWRTLRSGQGQETESAAIPVTGVAVLETHPAEPNNPMGYNYRIHTLWSEFNTAAWLVNNGVFTPEGEVTPVPNTPTGVGKREALRKLPTTKFDVGMA